MTGLASWNKLIIALIAGCALLSATAASAQDVVEKAEIAYRSANEFADEGMFDIACDRYQEAIGFYNSATLQLNSMKPTDESHKQNILAFAERVQREGEAAVAGQKATCNRPNALKYTFQKKELQRVARQAKEHSYDAVRMYEAHDRVGSCASARLAAESWNQVAQEMRANPVLEEAFGNPAQIYENGRQAAADRDGLYCQPDDTQYNNQKETLQSLVTRSQGLSGDAYSKYQAHDLVGACASARLAADGWNQAVQLVKANPALESVVGNLTQLNANAQQAALDRDKSYCAKRG